MSRKTFLRGMAGVAAGAGARGLWTTGSPTQRGNPAHPHAGQRASVTVDLSSATGIGQEITYWEVGNECDFVMDVETYSGYFNAIADALPTTYPPSPVTAARSL